MRYILVTIGVIITIGLLSCNKHREDPNTMTLPPNVLFYQFKQNDSFINRNELSDVVLYYMKNGDTISGIPWRNLHAYGTPLFQLVSEEMFAEGFQQGVCGLELIDGYLKEGNNTFYFKFPNGDIDTLYMEYTDAGNVEGKKYDCFCAHPLTTVLFNGKPAIKNPDLKAPSGKPIYIFEKD